MDAHFSDRGGTGRVQFEIGQLPPGALDEELHRLGTRDCLCVRRGLGKRERLQRIDLFAGDMQSFATGR